MQPYLMIQNPGVAPEESFILLGATTKRSSTDPSVIGSFGSGNKMSLATCLRNHLSPVVFAGSLKMEFGTRKHDVEDGTKTHSFEHVVIKFSGKDRSGKSRTNTLDLGFVLDYGVKDWKTVDLALREFVSNSLDRCVEEEENEFLKSFPNDQQEEAKILFQKKNHDFSKVVVEIVDENQVRAKNGFTRIFVPMNQAVQEFYDNIDKWFLHFKSPELLNVAILPKANRNIKSKDKSTAVIYRRGVRVRECASYHNQSLFDYNLESLNLDESRQVDDYHVAWIAGQTLAKSSVGVLAKLFQSISGEQKYWEHEFSDSSMIQSSPTEEMKKNWKEAFENIYGTKSVITTQGNGEMAKKKGYDVVIASENLMHVAEYFGVKTPAQVLTNDEAEGRELGESMPEVEKALDCIWELLEKQSMTNGKERPIIKTFTQLMSGGAITFGFWRPGENIIHINKDIVAENSSQLLLVVLEETVHYLSEAVDFSRDFQQFVLQFAIGLINERI